VIGHGLTRLKSRPEEEGIKTCAGLVLRANAALKSRPEEEGIKTPL